MTLQMLLRWLKQPPTINQNQTIMAYKFRQKEIEMMKFFISWRCKYNSLDGAYNAAKLRQEIESFINNPKTSKWQKQKAARDLALYEKLTLYDKPNW